VLGLVFLDGGNLVQDLEHGTILEGPYWPEPIRVVAARPLGRRLQIYASGMESRRAYDITLSLDDLATNVTVSLPERLLDLSGDAHQFQLALEAYRIRLAHEFDPHFAVSVSQIDPLPHQLEAVYHYMLRLPRIRFLLADDPGAGKTIMAGLLLKELKLRGLVETVLIVTPANLTDQWRREMKQRFSEVFRVIRRASIDDLYGRNIWEETHQAITSIDFAKREGIIEGLGETVWDLVIVDEAHKMAAYLYGDKRKESQRYKLGKILSPNAYHFVMLTATPHKGDPDNFRLLMQLLDREMFESKTSIDLIVQRQEIPLFLRRMKEDMVDFQQRRLFTQRNVKTAAFSLSEPEWELYQAVTRYIEIQSERAAAEGTRKGKLLGFALALLQRRLASSVRAIRHSLERRHKRLEILKQRLEEFEEGVEWTEEDLEEMTEQERWFIEEKLEQVTLARTKDELERECRQLENLVDKAKAVERLDTETKFQKLKQLLTQEGFFTSKTKLLVFTEHKDTLEYLLDKLGNKPGGLGFEVTQIHGGMRLGDEKRRGTRIHAEKEFREKAQIMVATEAAGEGINLQFCWVMVNYDIPWNPNRLEQRMGRIHRYGQTKDVTIFNLVAADTREGQVLHRLLEKIEEIRRAMGSDRVYDVISEIIPGASLDRLFREALANQRSWDEVLEYVEDALTPEKVETIRRATLEGLATRYIDINGLIEEDRRAREQRLVPEYIERFFLRAFQALGGTVIRRQDGFWRIERVPWGLRKVSPELQRRFDPVAREYRKFTFRKEHLKQDPEVELVGPGHPLFESVVDRVLREYASSLRSGAALYDPDRREPALVAFYHAKVQDGRGRQVGGRIFAIESKRASLPISVSPALLLDCKPAPPELDFDHSGIPPAGDEEEKILAWAYDHLFDPYLEEMRARRTGELDVAERHVRHSLDALIAESQSRLMKYRRRLEQGESMEAAIRQEEGRKRDLEERQKRRLEEIALERNLSLANPELIGRALILPLPEEPKDGGLRKDKEIEAIAMTVAMEYERKCARNPSDVSAENLGFDIRSQDESGELRYIEVKGRAGVGSIWLTPNEWHMAQRFGSDYWLYIVANATSRPQLHLVQDPAKNLSTVEEKAIVRYIVSVGSWKEAAIPAKETSS